jgi:hypothetical protein
MPSHLNVVVEPLSRTRRRLLFLASILFFLVAVPLFVFYATGYRYDFMQPNAVITATGGLYISVGNDNGEVYVNDEPANNARLFRKALYIQSVDPGVQRIHVQAPGYQTWVKELPVYPYMVTEAAAFLMPERPQVRPIAQYVTSTGTPIFLGVASSSSITPFASSSILFAATSSKATTTLTRSSEYDYIRGLFGTTTATSTSLITRVVDEAKGIFKSSVATTSSSTLADGATTTIRQNETVLYERGGDVYVKYVGDESSVPYYFCVPAEIDTASTSARYQAQLISAEEAYASEQGTTSSSTTAVHVNNTDLRCRHEIKIDRQWQDVISFQFFPGSTDLILMHRKDGVFVTEADDRAWQNTQKIYPASANAIKVDGGRIYVEDSGRLFEILTQVPIK